MDIAGVQGTILVSIMGAGLLIVSFVLVRMWLLLRRISTTNVKLGLDVKEDAKRYFDAATGTIINTDEEFHGKYQKIIEDGTRAAIADSGSLMEKSIAEAHDKAGTIILEARSDAQRIVQAANVDAARRSEAVLRRTGSAIEWVMGEYLGQTYSVAEHEALIEKQVKRYVDENR